MHKLACKVIARHSTNRLHGRVEGARAACKRTLWTRSLDSRSVHHGMLGRCRLDLNLVVVFFGTLLGDIDVDVWLGVLNELLVFDGLLNMLSRIVFPGWSQPACLDHAINIHRLLG